jgi:hypothetical protein
MTALAADRISQVKEMSPTAYPVKASTKIYAGAMVAIDTTGYAVPAADAAGQKVMGVARNTADNSASAVNGAITVLVDSWKTFTFNATSITQAMVGNVMYVVDDNTFDDAIGTNSIKAGRLIEFISTTSGRIAIPGVIP